MDNNKTHIIIGSISGVLTSIHFEPDFEIKIVQTSILAVVGTIASFLLKIILKKITKKDETNL